MQVRRQPTKFLNAMIVRTPENVGGAGGFYVGLRLAMQQGFDVAWLMDDDGAPARDCLSWLTHVASSHPIALLNPLVVHEGIPTKLAFGLRTCGRLISKLDEAFEVADREGIIYGSISPFNGTYVSREVYARIGDVKYECFIWGDELDYVHRARRAGLSVMTVVKALHRHPLGRGTEVRIAGLVSITLCQPARSHIHYRNLGFLAKHYHNSYFCQVNFILIYFI